MKTPLDGVLLRVLLRVLFALLMASSGGLMASCGSTPTLPLPPPVVMAIGAPNAQGLVTVQGEANEDAYVTVFNQQRNKGEITRAEANGHFVLEIAASVQDVLVIWQELDGVAGERTEQTVPEATP